MHVHRCSARAGNHTHTWCHLWLLYNCCFTFIYIFYMSCASIRAHVYVSVNFCAIVKNVTALWSLCPCTFKQYLYTIHIFYSSYWTQNHFTSYHQLYVYVPYSSELNSCNIIHMVGACCRCHFPAIDRLIWFKWMNNWTNGI